VASQLGFRASTHSDHCFLQVTNGGLQLTGVTLDTTPVAGIYLVSFKQTRTFG
jgi:hypothetical protein